MIDNWFFFLNCVINQITTANVFVYYWYHMHTFLFIFIYLGTGVVELEG